jgi:hypothetical protein
MRWLCEVAASLVVVATICRSPEARADAPVDASYGRIEGDVALVGGAGVVVAPRGPRLGAELRLRYLETAGLFATYEDAAFFGSDPEPRRAVATGLEIHPLFLARWLAGRETQRARLDLALDSMGLEIGAFFAEPKGGTFASRPGVQLGLGVELPIFARATGLWLGLHGGVRWSEDALATSTVDTVDDRSTFLLVTLQWHQLLVTHVVDLGDQAPH